MAAGVTEAVRVESYLDAEADRTLADDVLDGLTRPFKELPPKHLYDAYGSQLFERICELPEYYPTRTERSILVDQAGAIARASGASEVVELGAGYATKTRVLLDALSTAATLRRYVPVDVSETTVRDCARTLTGEYPGLVVHGLVGDFERHLHHVPEAAGRRLVVFLGGTIGNFLPGARRQFLRAVCATLRPDDRLLLGTDLVKDRRTLERAYDDAAGVTAEFNRNVLRVVNRELGADFDLGGFEHVARFDAGHEWIEMRLRARRAQVVRVPALDLTVQFDAGEEMRTEISAKFTPRRLESDLSAAGLALTDWFTDPAGLYALTLSRPTA